MEPGSCVPVFVARHEAKQHFGIKFGDLVDVKAHVFDWREVRVEAAEKHQGTNQLIPFLEAPKASVSARRKTLHETKSFEHLLEGIGREHRFER